MALEFESSDGIAAQALDLVLDGLPPDYWNRFPERIRGLTAEQVSAVLDRYLDPGRATIVLVGDARGFSKDLKKLGTVGVIPLPELDLGSPNLKASGSP